MTEHPRGVEPGGVGTTPNIAAQQETLGGYGMRSPRGFLGSVVLLLALPVAVLTQVLLGSGSAVTIHLALALGCALLSLAAFDFQTPRWVARASCARQLRRYPMVPCVCTMVLGTEYPKSASAATRTTRLRS